jgi:hypothetical protein
MKRVITGEQNGKAVITEVTDVQTVEPVFAQNMDIRNLWGRDGVPTLPFDGSDTSHSGGFYPPPGSVRITLIKFGPDGTMADGSEAPQQNEVTDLLDEDGLHATPTMDIGWIIDGELGLEIPGNEIVWMQQGDVVVQHGTVHVWHNRSGKDVLTGWVVLGAERA